MNYLKFLLEKIGITNLENETNNQPEQDLPKVVINDDKVNAILEEEIKDFFPIDGEWSSTCFSKSSEISYNNLPCHLRDTSWMSILLHKKLNNKGIYIPQRTIKTFMDISENFANLRHEYELKIVLWQIDWIYNGGEHWLMPKGYEEFSLLTSEDVDEIIRGGVVKTLKAIGMDREVIEEGIEKYSDMWRPFSMSRGFTNKYEPIIYLVGTPGKADESHKQNWLADREYRYYQRHRDSVDRFGTPTPAMKMTPEEHAKLASILEKQNNERSKIIETWRQNAVKSPFDN